MKSAILCIAFVTMAILMANERGYAAEPERASQRGRSTIQDDRYQGGRHVNEHHDLSPESHVPPRSPDLGIPTSPLSPSTAGPGSGLLGLEAGRTPAPSAPEKGTGVERRKR